ncbi:putative holin-like toxin [Alkalihalobacillus sp. TS-13]|uniref:putative holin-like toxin n=1 Tax=Alkalihalobacillus sp. TS-13 TaxID=2842455 RepID=UPI001C874AB3|nr:putative holin-like toxin [Alkalihalobacillus sp. TS-13]
MESWYNSKSAIEDTRRRKADPRHKQSRKGVQPLTAFEAISLMITFGLLIVTLLSFPDKRK